MATSNEIGQIENLFEESYLFLVRILQTKRLFKEKSLAEELRQLLENNVALYFKKPKISFTHARRNLNGRNAKNLSRAGLGGQSLVFKLKVAKDFLNKPLSGPEVKRTLDVLIAIYESLQRVFGLVIEPFIEALKIAKALL